DALHLCGNLERELGLAARRRPGEEENGLHAATAAFPQSSWPGLAGSSPAMTLKGRAIWMVTPTGRNRFLAAIIVEAAARLAAEPARLDIFHQQRAGPVLRVGEAFIEHMHDGKAGIEPDEIGELERSHRMVGAEPHRRVDRLDRADALIERVDGLVDHRQQDAVDDEGGEI